MAAGAIDGPGHWVGGTRTDATGLPVFGWSMTGGDLRVPHFFAAHLLQALPLVGWIADRSHSTQPRVWVWVALGIGIVWVSFTGRQALRGQPFWGG